LGDVGCTDICLRDAFTIGHGWILLHPLQFFIPYTECSAEGGTHLYLFCRTRPMPCALSYWFPR
jgi:hypothetical protein